MKHRTLITLTLLTTFAAAQDRPLTKEEIELERERLELQREQIELERRKLEVERMKILNQQSIPTTAYKQPKKVYTKDLYVGFDYLFPTHSSRTTTLNGVDTEQSAESQGYGLKFGFGTFDENRVEIAYSKIKLTLEEEEKEWDVAMLSLDYLFVYHEAFGRHLSPLIKIGLTSASSDSLGDTLEAMGYTPDENKKISGLGLRLGLGFFYLLDERMEMAFGFDSTDIAWADATLKHTGGTDKLELRDVIGTTYLTLSYRF
jgi:hypothetical protein